MGLNDDDTVVTNGTEAEEALLMSADPGDWVNLYVDP